MHGLKTLLFVPGSKARVMEKAAGLGADAVIIDLEDAVAPDAKAEARALVSAALASHDFGASRRMLRINAGDCADYQADLAYVRDIAVDAVVIPKVENPDDIPYLGGLPVYAMIETPAAVLAARDIAAVDAVAGLIAGTNDLCLELGCDAGQGRAALMTALQMTVLGARASGKAVFDGVYNDFSDAEGLADECRQGKMLGFDGKTLIHPNQIAVAEAVFRASEEDQAEARAMIAAYEAAGGGAVSYKGRMIEALHITAAKRLLGEG